MQIAVGCVRFLDSYLLMQLKIFTNDRIEEEVIGQQTNFQITDLLLVGRKCESLLVNKQEASATNMLFYVGMTQVSFE